MDKVSQSRIFVLLHFLRPSLFLRCLSWQPGSNLWWDQAYSGIHTLMTRDFEAVAQTTRILSHSTHVGTKHIGSFCGWGHGCGLEVKMSLLLSKHAIWLALHMML